MLRKIAIVGANGFVGRRLVETAAIAGADVVGIVRSEKAAEVVRKVGGRPILTANLSESATHSLVPTLEGCDGLVYTASVSEGVGNPDRTDPAGVVNVLRACHEASVPRIAYFSGLGIAHYGMNPHCTNPYFLGKMAAEVALFRSGLAVTVFRPSYIFGAGDEFLSPLIERIARDAWIEIPGDGQYRLQPVSVQDAARAVLDALAGSSQSVRVVDLVGPQALSYRALVERAASIMGRVVEIRERPVDETLALSRESGYFGLTPNDLACLLCDEISDPAVTQTLVGSPLESVDQMIAATRNALVTSPTAS